MAETVTKKWLYPVNWDGSYLNDGDPDPVEAQPMGKIGWKRMKFQISCISDGTGMTDYIVQDVSALKGEHGRPCHKFGIVCIKYNTYGMAVRLRWDMNPMQEIAILPESQEGTIEGPFYPDLGLDSRGKPIRVYDESETGDLLLTTIAHTANDSFNITFDIIVKEVAF